RHDRGHLRGEPPAVVALLARDMRIQYGPRARTEQLQQRLDRVHRFPSRFAAARRKLLDGFEEGLRLGAHRSMLHIDDQQRGLLAVARRPSETGGAISTLLLFS